MDDKKPASARAVAVRSLRFATFDDVHELLAELLASRQPAEVQTAAIETLASFDDAQGRQRSCCEHGPGMSPKLRATAAEALFARPLWIGAFLDAIEKGTVGRADVDPARLNLLKTVPRPGGTSAGLQALRRRVAPPAGRGRRVPEGPGNEGRPRAAARRSFKKTAHRATGSKTSASRSAPSSRRSATAASTPSCSTFLTPTARSCRSTRAIFS